MERIALLRMILDQCLPTFFLVYGTLIKLAIYLAAPQDN